MNLLLTILNGLAFIIYGCLCLVTDHMVVEFERYKMSKYRMLTGFLELCGGLGCLIGYFYSDFLYLVSCAGLANLMMMGSLIRIKVGDPFIQTIPAILLCVLNSYLFISKIMNNLA